jgi:Ca2+-transporting ATPase
MQDPPALPSAPRAARPDGLAEEEAARRLAELGRNEVGQPPGTPLWARVAARLRDPLILVLLGAVALTVLTGDHGDAVVIALVIVVNTGVGVVREPRADHAIAALTALPAPLTRVVRGGAEREVPSAGVVPGDVLLLGEGDIVPADADLLHSSALSVDESALTGESVPVGKDVRAAWRDWAGCWPRSRWACAWWSCCWAWPAARRRRRWPSSRSAWRWPPSPSRCRPSSPSPWPSAPGGWPPATRWCGG